MSASKASIPAALAALSLLLAVPGAPAQAQAQCASLLSSINQLKAQIPREPRDAAQADQQVLGDYVGLYNRACTGGGGGGGPGYVPRGGGNNPANALGAAANALGALGNLLDQLDQQQREEEAEQARLQQEQAMEEALEQAQQQAQARAQAAAARAAQAADQASRQAMANPFDSPSSSSANPFDTPSSKSANPFGTPSDATAPRDNGSGASQGFKSDAQIKKECAQSGNPSMCEGVEMAARSQDPAYRRYAAQQKKQLDKQVAQKQKAVDDAFRKFDEQQAKRTPPEQVGALPQILAGKLPPDDDGLECGTRNGRRHNHQCYTPWSGSPEACANELGGNYVPASDDNPTAFCTTDAAPNPMTAFPGPNEGAQCGDAAGHIHGGACWALGITRDDCRDQLHGLTIDNGGYQYCAYDAAQLAAEEKAAEAASAAKRKYGELADKLKKLLATAGDDDAAMPSGPGPVAQGGPAPAPEQTAAASTPPSGDAAAKPSWTPHYTCRLKDGSIIGTDDPTTAPGYDPTHSFCRLDNSPAMPGLTPGTGGK